MQDKVFPSGISKIYNVCIHCIYIYMYIYTLYIMYIYNDIQCIYTLYIYIVYIHCIFTLNREPWLVVNPYSSSGFTPAPALVVRMRIIYQINPREILPRVLWNHFFNVRISMWEPRLQFFCKFTSILLAELKRTWWLMMLDIRSWFARCSWNR